MIVVDLLYRPGKIWILRIEFARTPLGPPLPILNHGVERNVLVAIFLNNANQFVLTLIAVFRLEQSVRPLAKKRSMPGQPSIEVNDLVGLGTIKKVIINSLHA